MKILQVIPFFSPKFGGSVISTFLTCQKLSERGHDITVLTTDFHFDAVYAKKLKNVEVIPTESSLHIGLFLYSPKMKAWLSKNISKYDIIHLQNFRSYQNAIVSNYAKKMGIPYILQARGSVLPFFEKKLLKQAFDMMWGNEILKNAAKCIALTKTESDQYIKMGVPENKIVIIPNGLDLSQFSNLPERGTFRSKYKISDNEQIILFLGRIHKIKGIDLLIEAYAEVLKEIPNARLVIAGPDDNYISALQKQIRELKPGKMPLFTGPLYDQEKLSAYVDADVYVLPSRYEVFANTILESWACGTPVIVTTGCHIADVVEKAGIVVERDPVELAEAIKKIVLDEVLREKFSKMGKMLVNDKLNLDAIVDNIKVCYRHVIDNIKND
ncbi:MAG: glycosyltransferase [Methanolinea sp.]|nr:glycosyltransferase [Methanolinea sp.]